MRIHNTEKPVFWSRQSLREKIVDDELCLGSSWASQNWCKSCRCQHHCRVTSRKHGHKLNSTKGHVSLLLTGQLFCCCCVFQRQSLCLRASCGRRQPSGCGPHACACSVIQSCLTLRDPVGYSPPGTYVHGIL